MTIKAHMLDLQSESRRLGSEGKYLLVKLRLDVSWQDEPVHTTQFLSKLADMTPQTVVVAVKQLIANSYLESRPVRSEQKGKPYQFLALVLDQAGMGAAGDRTQRVKGASRTTSSGSRWRKLEKLPAPDNALYEPLIEHILLSGNRRGSQPTTVTKPSRYPDIESALKQDQKKKAPSKESKRTLNYSGRLLLCVLLRFADQGGVVRALGTRDLVRLTGMPADRIKYQLERLRELGYIHAIVAGIDNGKMFKAAKSAYFLNLRHESYGKNACPGTTLSLQIDILAGEFESRAYSVFEESSAYKRISQSKIHPLEKHRIHHLMLYPRLFGLFQAQLVDCIEKGYIYFLFAENRLCTAVQVTYCDMKINQYASQMLTECQDDLGSIFHEINGVEFKPLRECEKRLHGIIEKYSDLIRKDVFREEIRKHYGNEIPKDKNEEMISASKIMAIASLDIAILGYGCIKSALDFLPVHCRYTVIPRTEPISSKNSKLMTIESMSETGQPKERLIKTVLHRLEGSGRLLYKYQGD